MDYNCIRLHLEHHLQHKSPHFRISSLVLLFIVIPTLAADDFTRIDPLGKQILLSTLCALFFHILSWHVSCYCSNTRAHSDGILILARWILLGKKAFSLLFSLSTSSRPMQGEKKCIQWEEKCQFEFHVAWHKIKNDESLMKWTKFFL